MKKRYISPTSKEVKVYGIEMIATSGNEIKESYATYDDALSKEDLDYFGW